MVDASALQQLADAYRAALARRGAAEHAWKAAVARCGDLHLEYSAADTETREAREALLAMARGEELKD